MNKKGLVYKYTFPVLWVTIHIVALYFVIAEHSSASVSKAEKDYVKEWCESRGQQEVVLPDKTRCDCVTDTHAIEFDFGKKWTEAVGQSLYYSLQTGKRAGIVLILETKADRKYLIRLSSTIQNFNLPIDVWTVGINP